MQGADIDIIDGLRGAGLIAGDGAALEPLAGGVSCDVWKVETLRGPAVVKRPLSQLRVAAEWLAPVERGDSEVAWLKRAYEIDSDLVPEVWAELPDAHGFVMQFIPGCPVWKDELVVGHVDPAFAVAVGSAIARIHAATANSAADRQVFDTDVQFRALRIDPFLLHVADQDAEMAPILRKLANDLASQKIALVHGDVSPKNILVKASKPVLLDAECAVFGDPAFDVAFCVTHLLLKAVWLDDPRLSNAAGALVQAYIEGVDWEARDGLLHRAGMLAAALLLARVDGKSPAPYLTDTNHRHSVRMQARNALIEPVSIGALVADWKRIIE